MKKLVHVDGPEELREGDTFCGMTVARWGYSLHLKELRWWSDGMTNMDSDAKLLSAPFPWHPNGFEVEREVPAEPVVWEGRIPIRNGCVQDPLADLLLRAANCHAKHRVSIEEIEE